MLPAPSARVHCISRPEASDVVQTTLGLRKRRPNAWLISSLARRAAAWVMRQGGYVLHGLLTSVMLRSCESALEYMLALTFSPQVGLSEATIYH